MMDKTPKIIPADSSYQFRAGMIVEMLTRPEWGPGKVVHVNGDKLHVFFRDQEEKAAKMFRTSAPSLSICPAQSDPILDNLPPLKEADGRWELPKSRISLAQAEGKFLNHFPLGFVDPK